MRVLDIIIGIVGIGAGIMGKILAPTNLDAAASVATILVSVCVIAYYILRFLTWRTEYNYKKEELKKIKKENQLLNKKTNQTTTKK